MFAIATIGIWSDFGIKNDILDNCTGKESHGERNYRNTSSLTIFIMPQSMERSIERELCALWICPMLWNGFGDVDEKPNTRVSTLACSFLQECEIMEHQCKFLSL